MTLAKSGAEKLTDFRTKRTELACIQGVCMTPLVMWLGTCTVLVPHTNELRVRAGEDGEDSWQPERWGFRRVRLPYENNPTSRRDFSRWFA